MTGSLTDHIATLSGQTLKTYYHFEDIDEPGFYLSLDNTRIEHWSYPCDYTALMSHINESNSGLICDGWLSIISGDDIGDIANKVHNWHQHLVKYGVITQ